MRECMSRDREHFFLIRVEADHCLCQNRVGIVEVRMGKKQGCTEPVNADILDSTLQTQAERSLC